MLGELITSKTRLRLLVKFFISQANKGYLNGLASFITNLEIEKYKKVKLYKNDIREILHHFSSEIRFS